jgi:hypothetical protein
MQKYLFKFELLTWKVNNGVVIYNQLKLQRRAQEFVGQQSSHLMAPVDCNYFVCIDLWSNTLFLSSSVFNTIFHTHENFTYT